MNKSITLLLLFAIMGIKGFSNSPSEIYFGKKGLWYIYLDSRKEVKVVEVGGIKYGFLDMLNNTERNDTIASSKVGLLLLENGNYRYINKELKIDIELKKYAYTEKMDANRYKIFSIDAFTQISALKNRFKNTDYKINSHEVRADYLYYRDNSKMPEEYKPSYLIRFYAELKTLGEDCNSQ
ncbi:hypothetical protein D0T50_12330 [Bacteroides sp. 214]|uniref:hypothetical protein n=1 Tax=Bacteroides sp. 214 TaxID=2302935 RepID=UPI0013D78706|nr:hypothetical protein [Bacteroides sp. 214]NDW13671.1 hypothetical protein [Bacteroides sp. 214]